MCCLPRSTTCQILLYFIMLAHPVQSLFVQLRPHMMVSCSEEGEGLSRDSFLVCHILLSLIRWSCVGLDAQIQEIKESVELPLTHPEYYEEMGIKPPKVIIIISYIPSLGKTTCQKQHCLAQRFALFHTCATSTLSDDHIPTDLILISSRNLGHIL